MTTLSLGFIRAYQLSLGPVLRLLGGCRFIPSCSEYGYQAIARYGWWRGWGMALRRIGRCHPFHPGGWDPVP